MKIPGLIVGGLLFLILCGGTSAAPGGKPDSPLEQIILPRVELQDATPAGAVAYLIKEAGLLNPEGKSPDIRLAENPEKSKSDPARVTLSLRHIPLPEALEYVAMSAGLQLHLADGVAILEPIPPATARYEARIPLAPEAFARLAAPGENLAGTLRACGLVFDADPDAVYSAARKELFVRSNKATIEMVRALVAAVSEEPGDKVAAKAEPQEVLPDDPRQDIQRKLSALVIPRVKLDHATPLEALRVLRQQAYELDVKSPPESRGLNIVYVPPSRDPKDSQGARPDAPVITMSITNIPLLELLSYTCKFMVMKFKIRAHAVLFVPISTPTDFAKCRAFDATKIGFSDSLTSGDPLATGAEFKTKAVAIPATGLMTDAREMLVTAGISSPDGALAIYLRESHRLVVRNTAEELELVEFLTAP